MEDGIYANVERILYVDTDDKLPPFKCDATEIASYLGPPDELQPCRIRGRVASNQPAIYLL